MYGTRDQKKTVEVETSVQSALIKAVENGSEDEVKRLIDAGVAVDEIDNRGKNALFEAVSCCHKTLVHLLVEKGKAFVNARDPYGRTPLFYAITKSKYIARYLIEKGADVNLKDFSNRSALSFFVENYLMNNDIQLSSLISDKEDELNRLKDSSKDDQDELKMLQDLSKDVPHDITETILGIVFCKLPFICAFQHSEIWTKLRRETIEKTWTNFSPALKVVSTYFAETDTKKKTNLESILKDFEGKEPFDCTMCNNVIELLVESIGVDPNFADSDGNTALHYASSLPFLGVSSEVIMSMLRKLERYGLTINTRNHQKQTPLLFCLSRSMEHLKDDDKLTAMKTLVEVCKFLVTRGSSLEETTKDGESVFHLVIKLFQQGFEVPDQTIRQGAIDETMKILHLFSCDRLIKGRTVNKGNSRLNSPLHHWATLTLPCDADYSTSGMFESTLKAILEHLAKLGTTLNPRNEDEETPLHMCETWSAVKLLLENGANPNDVDSSGRSPMLAAANNKTFLTKPGCFYPDVSEDPKTFWKSAIEKGLDPWATDHQNKSVLCVLSESKAYFLVKSFLEFDCGSPITHSDLINITLLYAVQQSNNESVVRAFIDAGADVNRTDNEGKTALFYAVQQSNNESVVRALVDARADVNRTDNEGKTALFYAVQQSNNESVVCALIDAGADVNITDNEGKTALSFAVQKWLDKSVVRALIAAGADVNITDNEGKTALFYTVQDNKESVVRALIDAGADVNRTDNEGKTALIYAVKQKHNKSVVCELINAGTNVGTKSESTTALLHVVQQSNNKRVVLALIDAGADANITDNEGKTALFYAVQHKNNESVVRALIDAGADVNRTDNEEKTALFHAVQQSNNESVVRSLIDAGADVNVIDNEGKTLKDEAWIHGSRPIMKDVTTKDEGENSSLKRAVVSGNFSTVERLIQGSANVNSIDKTGKTALFYAVQQSNNESVVRALIDAGADVNITDNEEKTALFHAVQQSNNESVVRALIDAGADVNITDREGKSALFYAVQQSNNESVVRALIDAGADVNRTDYWRKTALLYAVQQSNNESVVRALIDAGADVNITHNEGKTALFYAVQQSKNESVVRALIDAGADVNITHNEGETALFYAVRQSNNGSVVRALIDAGADVNKTDNEEKTALFYAVQQSDNQTVVRALIDAGADVNINENEGKTALFYAVQQSNNECVVRALIDAGALLNVRDHYGRTPLYYVTGESHFLITNLLEKGANFGLEDNYRVLTFVIENFHEFPNYDIRDVIKILIERKVVTKKQILEKIVNVAFCKSLCFKQSSRYYRVDVEYLSALLRLANDYTSTIDVRKRQAIKKILYAITNLQKKSIMEPEVISKILRRLVKLGANPNCVDSDGNTALHHAIQLSWYGVPEGTVLYICKQLKEMGASFHIKNLKNETPLLHCLVSTIKNITSHSRRQRSDLNTQLAVCHFLIEHWSNAEEKTQDGQSALHLILEILRKVLLDKVLRKESLGEFIRLLRSILSAHKEKGLPAVNKDNSGNTPLHLWAKLQLPPGQDYYIAIAEGYTFKEILEKILHYFREKQALLHAKNENGETPLHLCRTWTAVELLLDAGANPKDVDSSGRSTLLFAARNNESVHNRNSLYPDLLLASDTEFWRTALKKGFYPWTADRHGESVLSVLIRSDSHDFARALVYVACDQNSPSNPLAFFSLLIAICKDKLPNVHWKKDAAEMILSSTKCPVNGNDNEDSPLHYCCRNIVEITKVLPEDEIQTSVHWSLAKLLRAQGADYRVPDATGKDCLEIAAECPALKELLKEPIDLDKFPKQIKNWKSVSKNHERQLQKVARHLESKHLEPYWYHKDYLACGSFGAVFAGINGKDGREVAIKRIEMIRMQRPEDKREIANLTAVADCEQVVRYLCFYEDKHFSYIVLELMEGNLDALLNHTISVDISVKLCEDVVKGLKSLHDGNILHRDLKPNNILYKWHPKLCLKIADFGLSRHIDCNSSTVYGTNAGTKCWIAPEVLRATKDQHSAASDMFSCGLVLHYILSVKKHPFSPEDSASKSEFQICNETETNVINDNKEGWDDSLSPEATNLVERLLESTARKRPTAAESLAHPLFWPKTKKVDLLFAVGNQPEFECPRAKRKRPLTLEETDLETSFGTIVKYGDWNDPGYVHMPTIYNEMTRRGRRYDIRSVVELVRFIRNAYAHVPESTRPTPIRKQLLEDFVFLEYFPNLVMEVYKAVTTHGWDQTREEVKYAMKK